MKEYCFSYQYRGKSWVGTVHADSLDDARCKVKAIAKSTVDGELKMTILVPSVLQRFMSWLYK